MEESRTKPDNFAEVATMLREQIDDCHSAVRDLFYFARGGNPPVNYTVQMEAMKTATRLMQASATAANALKRLAGTESRHTVAVEKPAAGGIPTPPVSKTNVPDAATA